MFTCIDTPTKWIYSSEKRKATLQVYRLTQTNELTHMSQTDSWRWFLRRPWRAWQWRILFSAVHWPSTKHKVTCEYYIVVNVDLYSASTQMPLTRSDMDHTVLPANHTISAFTPQPHGITALWPVLIAPIPTKVWPGWVDLGGWLDWDEFSALGVEPRYGHPSQY